MKKTFRPRTSQWKKKISIVPKIRNGAKGISLLIVKFLFINDNDCNLDNKIKNIPKTDPIQNERIIAESPSTRPKNHPIPKANLASPKPIHLPSETSHKTANGVASIGPAKTSNHTRFPH
jgi:hypothetical protein